MASSTITEAGTSDPTAAQVAQVRAFNRFYTNVIGVLHGPYLDSPFTLTEGRLLFEIARRDTVEVSDLRRALDIDAGYLSRVLTRFEAESLVTRHRSPTDARRQEIRVAEAGRAAAPVDPVSRVTPVACSAPPSWPRWASGPSMAVIDR